VSFFDKARAAVTDAVTDAVDKHGDTIASGLDKAAAMADEKTGGKHHGPIATGAGKAKEALHRLGSKGPR
jgi:hypothetical protein